MACVDEGVYSGNNQQQRREFEEFLARAAAAEGDDSGALGFSTLFKVGKTIFDIGKSFFSGGFVLSLYTQKMACVDEGVCNSNNQQQRREFEEFLARAAAAEGDDSGALGFSTLFKVGKTIFDLGKSLIGGK